MILPKVDPCCSPPEKCINISRILIECTGIIVNGHEQLFLSTEFIELIISRHEFSHSSGYIRIGKALV